MVRGLGRADAPTGAGLARRLSAEQSVTPFDTIASHGRRRLVQAPPPVTAATAAEAERARLVTPEGRQAGRLRAPVPRRVVRLGGQCLHDGELTYGQRFIMKADALRGG